jgi:hypothetical protein
LRRSLFDNTDVNCEPFRDMSMPWTYSENLHILLPTICRNEINDADNLSQKSGIAEFGQETNRDRPSRWLRERNGGLSGESGPGME